MPTTPSHESESAGLQPAARRRMAAANTIFALVLAVVLAGMLHYLSARHYLRTDWSRSQFYALSDRTRLLLDSLEQDVEIVALFPSGHDIFEDLDSLLREYESASSRLRVRRVDPARDLDALAELARTYPLTEDQAVIVVCEGRNRIIPASDLEDLDYSMVQFGQPPERLAFKGEQAISSAIQQVTQGGTPTVYVMSGHGERSVESFERGLGFAQIARIMRQDNMEVRPLSLSEHKAVPEDAAAVLLPGPSRRIPQPELDMLAQYLERGGRMVVLLEAGAVTGLEPMLERWGVRIGPDLVVDPSRTLGGGMVIGAYGRHAITERLGQLASVLYRPRSVEPASPGPESAADRPRAVRLALTTEQAWAEMNPDVRPARFDAGVDGPGPVSVAVAVERGGPAADPAVLIPPTRLVVFGDCTFVANGGIVIGNADLFMSAINWVLDRGELLAIAPKTLDQMRLDLGPRQVRGLAWFLIAGLPLAAAVMGWMVMRVRRS
ncbi:MAG: GldG family protein [Kiritimatiellae bacterium]|nr:GldG family protein [Kiritimatiellia bacterium]